MKESKKKKRSRLVFSERTPFYIQRRKNNKQKKTSLKVNLIDAWLKQRPLEANRANNIGERKKGKKKK